MYLTIDSADFCTLTEHVTGWNRAQQRAYDEDPLDPNWAECLEQLLNRRLHGEPVAYITGTRWFYGSTFFVTPNVLIPRPETELLIDLILDYRTKGKIKKAPIIWEVGTGSGCVAISLKLLWPEAQVFASDNSWPALSCAKHNAISLGAGEIHWVCMDVLTSCQTDVGICDILVSNPPYIPWRDPHLQRGDLRFEPKSALTDHSDGLTIPRKLCHSSTFLKEENGLLLIEHGYNQAQSIRAIMNESRLQNIATHQDLSGRDRVTLGWRKQTKTT